MASAYGPPGYGETPRRDVLERYPALMLERPICVARGIDLADEPESSIRRLQLVQPNVRRFDPALLDRLVRVTGKLFHAVSGHHHTAVLVDVLDVQKAR